MACKSNTRLSPLDYKKDLEFLSVKDYATMWCKASLTDKKYPSQKVEQED